MTDVEPQRENPAEIFDLAGLIAWLDNRHQQQHDLLAAEVHDQLGSALTALAMRLALIERQSNADPKLVALWGKANVQLGMISQAARHLQHQLRPVALEALGLHAALTQYLHQFGQRSGIACELTTVGAALNPPLADAQVIFRIVQEALFNAECHANASHLQLLLVNQPQQRSLTIVDDGVGFDSGATDWSLHHGVRLMHERAGFIAARIALVSAPGQGCRVTLTLSTDG